jgi:hypothetical protein
MEQAKAVDTEYVPPGALEAISRAEIDVAISTARKFPQHSPDKLAMVKQNMLSFACLDVETAEACFYSLPRGGKLIQGPSVRLAEIAVACYGNLRAGTRIIETVTEGSDPHVVIQAVAMDLEKNIQVSIEKRRRIVKKKSKDKIDEDDVNLATNACSAIAFRDSVYKVIPLALIKPVYEAAKKVAVGDQKTLLERRTRCLETFAKMGIQKDRILAKLEKATVEEINLEDLEMLIGLYTALKDGEVNIDEAFPAPATNKPVATGHQQATQGKVEEKKETPKPADKPADKAPETPKAPEATGTPATAATPASEPVAAAAPAPEKTAEPSAKPETTAEQPGDPDAIVFEQIPAPQEQAVPDAPFVPNASETAELQNIRFLLHKHKKTEGQLIDALRKNKAMREDQKHISELSTNKLVNVGKAFPKLLEMMG